MLLYNLCWAGELLNHFMFLSSINLESVNKDNDSGVAFSEIMVRFFLVIIHQFTIIMSVNINRERVTLQSNSVTHNLQSGAHQPTGWCILSLSFMYM